MTAAPAVLAAASGVPRAATAALVVAAAAFAIVAFLAARRLDRRRAPGARDAARPAASADPAPVAAAAQHPRVAWPGSPAPGPGSRAAEVLALFGDLRPGEALARWTVDWIGDAWDGAVRVGLVDGEGRAFQVEVRRSSPDAPAPPGAAGPLAVYLIHVAGGPTPEEQGLGAMALASWLEGVGAPAPAWLRPLGSRSAT